ncbi:alpha/beta hydrolase [Clostridium sp. AM58-1XD]|uniref:alpha/beta hydrolase n=1 Tax=Clostridium sp. AM58-1XD TaxID=2292307 RepID=UPI000E49F3AE|nr:alpha/beta hydrolase [Clostridium sp. AM58-1XD]RGY97247.1 alpha/beta hydrolase [Clostridium sp. AM58-1XD]
MKIEKIVLEAGENSAFLTGYIRTEIEAQKGRRRPAVIICPGGGYERCSDREAEPVAMQFSAMGYHAFVLEYSVAPYRFPAALLELAKAVAYLRSRGKEWEIDTERIAVCGFSAGGHLAASLGVFWNREDVYGAVGETPEAVRPDRLILCYPVISSGEYGHQDSFRNLLGEAYGSATDMEMVSLEKQAGAHVPPVFMWHTDEDATVPAENSMLFAMALRKAGVSLEYHLFPHGRHGLSLATEDSAKPEEDGKVYVVPCCQQWIPLVKEWLGGWSS